MIDGVVRSWLPQGDGPRPAVVVVTSPKGGSGKTMVSMMLGWVTARFGARVLVVGAGVANDEQEERARKLMLSSDSHRLARLRDRPYPQQWARHPQSGYQVVPGAKSRTERTRELVLADLLWLLNVASTGDVVDVIVVDAPPAEHDPLTEAILASADVLVMVVSHDKGLQRTALDDLQQLTRSATGRPRLDPSQVRVVFNELNGDITAADLKAAEGRFDGFLWMGSVPYHEALWRGNNEGDIFGSTPAKVMAAMEPITRMTIGTKLAGPAPVKRRRFPRRPASVAAVVGARPGPAAVVVPSQPGPVVDADVFADRGCRLVAPNVLLRACAVPLPQVGNAPGMTGPGLVASFLLAARNRPQDAEMLASSGAGDEPGRGWPAKAYEAAVASLNDAGGLVRINKMLALGPDVRADFVWLAEQAAAAADIDAPMLDRDAVVNGLVQQLALLEGPPFGGVNGEHHPQWSWAFTPIWLRGTGSPFQVAQHSLLTAALNTVEAWNRLRPTDSGRLVDATVVETMLQRLSVVVLPQFAPEAFERALAVVSAPAPAVQVLPPPIGQVPHLAMAPAPQLVLAPATVANSPEPPAPASASAPALAVEVAVEPAGVRGLVLRTMSSPACLGGLDPTRSRAPSATVLSMMMLLDYQRDKNRQGSATTHLIADAVGSKSPRTIGNYVDGEHPWLTKRDSVIGLRSHVDSDWRRIVDAAELAGHGDRGGWHRLHRELSTIVVAPYAAAEKAPWASSRENGPAPCEVIAARIVPAVLTYVTGWVLDERVTADELVAQAARVLQVFTAARALAVPPWQVYEAALIVAVRERVPKALIAAQVRHWQQSEGHEPPSSVLKLMS